tara:strand:- start:4423 stop:5019 length:597 start_codon:yes stop_codon:yes gene_type:complete
MNNQLNEFYMLKKMYSKNKSKCVRCNRSVGTTFTAEYWDKKRVLHVRCGDSVSPCDLNKEVTIHKNMNSPEHLAKLNNDKLGIETTIIRLKNRLLHELVSQRLFDSEFESLTKQHAAVSNQIQQIVSFLHSIELEKTNDDALFAQRIYTNSLIDDRPTRIHDMLSNIYPIRDKRRSRMEVIEHEERLGIKTYELQIKV